MKRRLTALDAVCIRLLYGTDAWTQIQLARRFGVQPWHIRRALKREAVRP